MTEIEALKYAQSGRANYATDRLLTQLGHDGLWTLEQTGEEPVEPYVQHGGFYVDRWATFTSKLTPAGEQRLAELTTA